MKCKVVIYLAIGPSGDYDTYYEEILGAFLDPENAKRAGEDWYKKNTNPDLPMTMEEYESLNEGYQEDDYDHEGERNNLGGHRLEDFDFMDEVWENQFTTFHDPMTKEVEIKDLDSLEKLSDLLKN